MGPWRSRLGDALAAAAIALALLAGRAWLGPSTALDSDRHYHLAVSRAVPWTGHLRALPQAEDLGWATHYVDKEYLFHLITGWGYRLGGVAGVDRALWLLSLVAALGLYALCRTAAPPLVAALFTLGGALANETFLFRIQMLRPQVLAIGLFLWLCVALSGRRAWAAGALGAAFALAYHALYVPAAAIGLFALAYRKERPALVAAAAAVGGLGLGAVVHPDFPRNLAMTWIQASIGLGAKAGSGSGLAVLPVSTKELLLRFAGPIVLLLAAALSPWWSPIADLLRRRRTALWTAAAGVFWGLACLSPRAAEYAVPLAAVAAAACFGDRPLLAAASACLALALNVPTFRGARDLSASERYALAVAPAVARLPPDAAGKKVLNCSFDEGSVLLDLRPDVRFVDALDSTLLARAAPALAAARARLEDGDVADPAALVGRTFGANYVLCGYPEAVALLDRDPRFVRFNPPPGPVPAGPKHSLYALVDDPLPLVARLDTLSGGRPTGRFALRPGSAVFDLRGGPRDALGCTQLAVPPEDIGAFQGAQLALLGGGPRLTLRVDGARVFAGDAPFTRGRWNAVLVPLPAPLRPTSQVELEVCPTSSSGASSLSLSFWSWDAVQRWCARIGRPLRPTSGLVEIERDTCLAPLAVTGALDEAPAAGPVSAGDVSSHP
ncbi:MAG TPA: hypothetical protein VMB50_13275 [Myxococcales bacterium]|nr:hypothetical protein [Myxococcales bacterium]